MSANISSENLYQLVYASKAVDGFSEKDLIEILSTSRRNNKELKITGALVYNKGYFLQLLEGDRETVETLFNVIADDVRHEKVNSFFRCKVSNRIFPDWYMGFFQHEVDESLSLSGLVNLYDSQHPASQFFVEKLLEVRANLQLHQSTAEANNISDINWIIEEICSPSMRLMFDMLRDPKLAIYILRLKLGFDSLSVGVIITDLERNIAYINSSAVTILSNAEDDIRTDIPDFNVDELIGKNIDLFHKHPAHQINILDKLANTKEYVTTIGGRLLSIKTTIIEDEFKQRIGFMAEVDDITVREKNKIDLEASIEKNLLLHNQVVQMQKIESISRLTSGIAHDFNNLLMAISGYNEFNKLSAEDVLIESISRAQVHAELLENFEQIQIASGKAASLIEKMLLYCRRDGEIDIVNPILDLNTVLQENIKMLRSTIPNTITFETNLVEQTFDLSHLDETYLNQIIVNLFINARDAMNGRGTITLTTRQAENIEPHCSCCQSQIDGRFIEISVKDNGSGIEPDVARRIFEPFYTTKPVGEGTGLGLSVIVGILHNLGGHILLESEVSVGTTFRLFFPLNELN
jgi:signal transduction histidine kinase